MLGNWGAPLCKSVPACVIGFREPLKPPTNPRAVRHHLEARGTVITPCEVAEELDDFHDAQKCSDASWCS